MHLIILALCSWMILTIVLSYEVVKWRRNHKIMKHQAHHDLVTGLPNRQQFNERMRIETKRADRNDKKLALLFMDLDYFKTVNDKYGHAAGDEVLRLFSERITDCVRDVDFVSRFGGDEFIIVLTDIKNTSDVTIVINKIYDSLKKPFIIKDNVSIQVSCSMGVSIYSWKDTVVDALLKRADIALFKAKENGRGRYAFI